MPRVKQEQVIKDISSPPLPWIRLFAAFLIAVVSFGSFWIVSRYKKPDKKPTPGTILGEQATSLSATTDELKKRGYGLTDPLIQNSQSILNTSTRIISDSIASIAAQSSKTVSDFMYDQTIGNVLRQINTLPPDQANKIREYVCK